MKEVLENPLPVFEYQQELRSTKNELKNLEKREKEYTNFINGTLSRKERLKEQHEHKYITLWELNKKIKELDQDRKAYEEKLHEIRKDLAQHTLNNEYTTSLEIFSQKYKDVFKDVDKDRKKVREILCSLIEEIIVYSRPVQKTDVIAGVRKDGQMLPNRLHIKLKLPHEIVRSIPSEAVLFDDSSMQNIVSGGLSGEAHRSGHGLGEQEMHDLLDALNCYEARSFLRLCDQVAARKLERRMPEQANPDAYQNAA